MNLYLTYVKIKSQLFLSVLSNIEYLEICGWRLFFF